MSDKDLQVRDRDVIPHIDGLRNILMYTDGVNIYESPAASLAGYLQSCTQYNELQDTYKKLKEVLVKDTNNMEKLLCEFQIFDDCMRNLNQVD